MHVWRLEELQGENMPEVFQDGVWMPAKPLNSERKYLSVHDRLKRAWLVFTCVVDCFYWPEDEPKGEQ